MQKLLVYLYISVSSTFHLPPGLLSAVCYTETKHTPSALHADDGGNDSIGACQVQLPTARYMGFRGTEKDLYLPKVNVRLAGAYLAYQLKRYHGDVEKAVAAYNAGTHRLNKKGLTVNRRYVNAVLKAWEDGK